MDTPWLRKTWWNIMLGTKLHYGDQMGRSDFIVFLKENIWRAVLHIHLNIHFYNSHQRFYALTYFNNKYAEFVTKRCFKTSLM
jgi:hypothetical protein